MISSLQIVPGVLPAMAMFRLLSRVVIFGILLVILVLTIFNISLNYTYSSRINNVSDKLEFMQAVIIPGASVLKNKKPSPVLLERLQKGLELYKGGKVAKLLLSGDNAQRYYDEVNVMRDYCLERGVKPEDIFLDHAGLRTYDTMYRTLHVYQAKNIFIVSQKLFLPRALFIADHLGINAFGIPTDTSNYEPSYMEMTREFLARYMAILDIYALSSQPRYLGKKHPITGDGQSTWNKTK